MNQFWGAKSVAEYKRHTARTKIAPVSGGAFRPPFWGRLYGHRKPFPRKASEAWAPWDWAGEARRAGAGCMGWERRRMRVSWEWKVEMVGKVSGEL